MSRGVSVMLVDDHVLFRQALCHLLENEPDIRVVAEASDGVGIGDLVDELRPDVVVMDISMPAIDGISATQSLREENPNIGIIVLTMFAEDSPDNIAGLTEREISLLQLVAEGLSNKEIAAELGLAESTAKNRLSILFQKLNVKDHTQAAIYAMTHGLVMTPVPMTAG